MITVSLLLMNFVWCLYLYDLFTPRWLLFYYHFSLKFILLHCYRNCYKIVLKNDVIGNKDRMTNKNNGNGWTVIHNNVAQKPKTWPNLRFSGITNSLLLFLSSLIKLFHSGVLRTLNQGMFCAQRGLAGSQADQCTWGRVTRELVFCVNCHKCVRRWLWCWGGNNGPLVAIVLGAVSGSRSGIWHRLIGSSPALSTAWTMLQWWHSP